MDAEVYLRSQSMETKTGGRSKKTQGRMAQATSMEPYVMSDICNLLCIFSFMFRYENLF
jgi:hypothetical protein